MYACFITIQDAQELLSQKKLNCRYESVKLFIIMQRGDHRFLKILRPYSFASVPFSKFANIIFSFKGLLKKNNNTKQKKNMSEIGDKNKIFLYKL